MSDLQREKFEAWAKKHHGAYSIASVNGIYSNHLVANDWFVWQAAIESQAVSVHALLEKAGIKYE